MSFDFLVFFIEILEKSIQSFPLMRDNCFSAIYTNYKIDKKTIAILDGFVYNVFIVVFDTTHDQWRAKAFPKGDQYICTQPILFVIFACWATAAAVNPPLLRACFI